MNVAVLGCGPSGLLAAHAARKVVGEDVTLLSMKSRSPILGGQYLHIEVPGITGEASHVTYLKMGDTEGYSQKVYGRPDVPCFRFPAGEYPAWSLTEAYNNLWLVWQDQIEHLCVTPDDIEPLCEEYDLVLSTIPRDIICYKDHDFRRQLIRVAQGGTLLSPHVENIVLYSGRSRDSWYRTSNLFGHHTTEWSQASTVEMENQQLFDLFDLPPNEDEAHQEIALMAGFKPLSTDCDCHSEHDNFHRLGRFGQWSHGVLVSDAFEQAQTIIKEADEWLR
jgi:hypothetical protein